MIFCQSFFVAILLAAILSAASPQKYLQSHLLIFLHYPTVMSILVAVILSIIFIPHNSFLEGIFPATITTDPCFPPRRPT